MSHIAEQLNSKLSEPSGDSVDLDNLFAFLSDVKTSRNHIIDEIGEKMDELVTDLDVEVKYLYIPILYIELNLFNKILILLGLLSLCRLIRNILVILVLFILIFFHKLL